MVHLPCEEDESEDGDRVSFPRWGKRNVVSHHFTEPILLITFLEMLPIEFKNFLFYPYSSCSSSLAMDVMT